VKTTAIRDAREDELAAIVAIYNSSIPGRLATADTEFVSVESRREWFRDHDRAHHPLWVLERDQTVAGWFCFEPFYGRPAYAATAEISVYVAPRCRSQGVATALLAHSLEAAPSLGLSTLLGFIFAHNTPSVALFKRFGVRTVGSASKGRRTRSREARPSHPWPPCPVNSPASAAQQGASGLARVRTELHSNWTRPPVPKGLSAFSHEAGAPVDHSRVDLHEMGTRLQ